MKWKPFGNKIFMKYILGNIFKVKCWRRKIAVNFINCMFIIAALSGYPGFTGRIWFMAGDHATGCFLPRKGDPGGCNFTSTVMCGNGKMHPWNKDQYSKRYSKKFLHYPNKCKIKRCWPNIVRYILRMQIILLKYLKLTGIQYIILINKPSLLRFSSLKEGYMRPGLQFLLFWDQNLPEKQFP